MKAVIYILVFLLIHQLGFSQQKYEEVNQLWGAYYNSIKIGPKFSVNTDLQGRTTDWYKQWSQVLARTGVSFKPNEKFSLSLGYADFLFFQKGNKVSRNEYRPWQEIGMIDTYGQLRISHRFRLEQRYFQQVIDDELINKYAFNHRFRYRLDFQYPIWKGKESDRTLNLQFGNEIMANAGKSIVYNYFDQNRTWLALLFTVNKNLAFQLQYINIFQQLANGITLDRINVIRVSIYHSINL